MLTSFYPTDENDFNTTVRLVTFPADEGMNPMTDVIVPLPIVNDEINEACDQFFIAHLEAVSTIKILTIERSVSTCIIVDNDRKCNELK